MNMASKMKEKAIPITNTKLSNRIVKRITRAEIVELNRQMEPIILQNNQERIASMESFKGYKSAESPHVKSLKK